MKPPFPFLRERTAKSGYSLFPSCQADYSRFRESTRPAHLRPYPYLLTTTTQMDPRLNMYTAVIGQFAGFVTEFRLDIRTERQSSGSLDVVPRSSISLSDGVVSATSASSWRTGTSGLFGGAVGSVFCFGGIAYGWLGRRRIRGKVLGDGGWDFMALGERSCLCVLWIWDSGDSGEWLGHDVVWCVFVLIY